MSLVCHRCGYSNEEGAERCGNPIPLSDGSLCNAELSGWVQAWLSKSVVAVMPGESANCQLKVRNRSQRRLEIEIEIEGWVAEWASAKPSQVSLEAGEDASVGIALRPPRSSGIARGSRSFRIGIRVPDSSHPEIWIEGTIEILPYVKLEVSLRPIHSLGRRSGSHRVVIANQGNSEVEIIPSGSDLEGQLNFRFLPSVRTVTPGATAEILAVVRPTRLIWWEEPPGRHKFEIKVQTRPEAGVMSEAGIMLQKPVFPVRPWQAGAAAAILLSVLMVMATAGYVAIKRSAAPVVTASPQPSPSPEPSPTPTPSPSPSPSPSPTARPTPPPPPTTPPPPSPGAVVVSGSTDLPRGQCLLLDTGQVDCASDYDIYAPSAYNYIGPDNGATIHDLGEISDADFDALDAAALRKLTYDPKPISHPIAGHSFAVKTLHGNYAKVRIVDALPASYLVRFTTYAG